MIDYRGVAVLSEISSHWNYVARNSLGKLKIYTHMPFIDNDTHDVVTIIGNVGDLSMMDNGAFDFIKIGQIELISQYTYKNYRK